MQHSIKLQLFPYTFLHLLIKLHGILLLIVRTAATQGKPLVSSKYLRSNSPYILNDELNIKVKGCRVKTTTKNPLTAIPEVFPLGFEKRTASLYGYFIILLHKNKQIVTL